MGRRVGPDTANRNEDYGDVYADCRPDDSFDTNGWGPSDFTGSPRWSKSLERTIASEVIPRLMLAHGAGSAGKAPELGITYSERGPDAGHVAEFTRIILAHDTPVALAFVDAMLDSGVSLEAIFLDLVSASARLLGEMWSEDICNFTDVTVGLARLQQVLRTHASAFEAGAVQRCDDSRRAVLLSMPGEQHTLGIFLVETFLRRAGWDVWSGPPLSSADLAALMRRDWFSLIGLSISADSRLGELAGVIRTVRRESLNREIGVMVGGRVFVDHPEWASVAGADAVALEAKQAVIAAENIVCNVERRC